MYAKAVATNDGRVTYVAPTFQQARDIVWMELKKICVQLQTNVNESRLEITVRNVHGTTSQISLHGWESIETMRGQKYDLLVLDELSDMREFTKYWEEVLRPALTDRRGDGLFIGTPKGFNDLYTLFNKESTDPDYKSFHYTTYDNPYMPREEIDKARKEMTEDRFAQEYLADFRKMEGLVYKEFDREKHLFRDYEPHGELLAGVDFGFTNPCAVVHVVKDYDARYWVTNLFYKKGQTEEAIAEYVANQKFSRVYADPEAPSAIEVMKKKTVNLRDVVKNKDSIKNGINKVRELLKAHRLMIHESCFDLIQEFESYAYPNKKVDRNEEENPIKENDHALDALRYVLMMDDHAGGEGIVVNYADYSLDTPSKEPVGDALTISYME
jgi:PBSX family phage terminase large subunit